MRVHGLRNNKLKPFMALAMKDFMILNTHRGSSFTLLECRYLPIFNAYHSLIRFDPY